MRYWAVVPAAGTGERVGGDTPKQYLQLCGRAVLEHALAPFRDHPDIAGIVVALAPEDRYWHQLAVSCEPRVRWTRGGKKRCQSVLLALQALAEQAQPADWVLVHDAARPCLHPQDLRRLLRELSGHPCGGLLAIPVTDTLKCTNARKEVLATVTRERLWRALTPQMFRFSVLHAALEQCLHGPDPQCLPTDEAQAVELAGGQPVLIEGRPDNLKITHGADLVLAEAILLARQEQG